ncbi:MAG TPA: hypothetical protein QF802_06830 [Candidatus Thalassarchaeaceae archaeon]|jgi:hypothetical protein|nr:hypothetical protein [Candidatus Thalassarchaeaceae archaeon]HJL59167.1 hypothetical protein [Candidatus Thalassarchaeaceae archaeon]HJM20152.1 hypothetical protein [Candidatus Thalassarchaeaceae archaeon]HJM86619.1 hypothetical protein [Candidatus Thalassarchaeaceae archaeon]
MSWFRRLFARSSAAEEREKTFEEQEEELSNQLAEDYAKDKDETISNVLSELDDETLQKPNEEISDVPVDFHVEQAEADDLLVDAPLVDHYGMNKGDEIDPNTADQHFVDARSVDDEMSGYEQVDVPVMDDDIQWETK